MADQVAQQQTPGAFPMFKPGTTIKEIVTTKEPVDEGTRKWQLSGIDVIEEIRQRLKGNVFDDEKGEWTTFRSPICNEWGIGEICWLVASYINKNQLLSYFEPEEISKKLIDFECTLTRKFEFDWHRMGIRQEDVDIVFLTIADAVWSATNRARFGGEKQFIEGTEQRRIIATEGRPDDQQKGWINKIPLLGGK